MAWVLAVFEPTLVGAGTQSVDGAYPESGILSNDFAETMQNIYANDAATVANQHRQREFPPRCLLHKKG
jgi:hypothetical protein